MSASSTILGDEADVAPRWLRAFSISFIFYEVAVDGDDEGQAFRVLFGSDFHRVLFLDELLRALELRQRPERHLIKSSQNYSISI